MTDRKKEPSFACSFSPKPLPQPNTPPPQPLKSRQKGTIQYFGLTKKDC